MNTGLDPQVWLPQGFRSVFVASILEAETQLKREDKNFYLHAANLSDPVFNSKQSARLAFDVMERKTRQAITRHYGPNPDPIDASIALDSPTFPGTIRLDQDAAKVAIPFDFYVTHDNKVTVTLNCSYTFLAALASWAQSQ